MSGWGAVSCFGTGATRLWRGLQLGRDGITRIRRFSTAGFGVEIAGLVPAHNRDSASRSQSSELCVEYALAAASEAWSHARLQELPVARERVAFVMGSSPGADSIRVFELTEQVAAALDLRGPRLTVSTACTSSTNALGWALDLLAAGYADVVIAGGADVLTPAMFAGFHALGVLSREKCGPFSERYGTTLGEGAGFLVLETRAGARARGVEPRAVLAGYGLSADAFHETGPDPTGSGVARAIRGALDDAGIEPERVGYVNAHGTGTHANDPAEWRALLSVFGTRANELPISSTKSVIGHAQSAAGALETIATLICMERGLLPQTLNMTTPRANSPPDVVAQTTPRVGSFRYAVCTNSAFGGANAALVVAPADTVEMAPRGTRRVFVSGVGCAGAASELKRFSELDLADLDPSSRWLTAAAVRALDDADIHRIRGPLRDQTGLVCGIDVVSPKSIRKLRESIEQRGLPFLSATAFARMVLNAPAGTCSKLLCLRGPLSTVSAGPASGLLAILYAATMMERRTGVALMLAAGVEEPDDSLLVQPRVGGAACVLLSAGTAVPRAGRVLLAGWSIAGPGRIEDAIGEALARAHTTRESVEVEFNSRAPGEATDDHEPGTTSGGAVSSAIDFVRATRWARSSPGGTALVVAHGSGSVCSAAVLKGLSA